MLPRNNPNFLALFLTRRTLDTRHLASNPFDQDEEVAGLRSLKNILRQFGLAVIIGDRYDLMVPIIDSLGGKESHGQIANELRLHSGSPGELRTQGSANNSSMQ
ncbi:hypothetical protein FQN55_004353 [Onygenales sp. PD_40]|nr:hypothetical protein FQN55_004353 [Onygenales sp. PD_40]